MPSTTSADFLTPLKVGSILTKLKRNGEKYSRHFYLDEHEDFISYNQSEKVFAQAPRYYIRDIDEVRPGFDTLTFDGLLRHQVVHADNEELAFSIIYNNYRDELHLMADDAQMRNIWVSALQHLIDQYPEKQRHHIIRDNNWILSCLRFGDKDQSNTMTKSECKKLLKNSLNIELTEEIFDKLFQNAAKSDDNVLTPDDFIQFFAVLTCRNDLLEIMQQYVKNGDEQTFETIRMTVEELFYFLQTVQDQKILIYASKKRKSDFSVQLITTYEQVQRLINEYEPYLHLRKKNLLSFDGFRNLMMADDFSLAKPWCVRRSYQDMSRPLTDYYINTSHNTYLFDSQVSGNSNPEAYNRALRAGCRVVEIDCYDGDHGQPIVTHRFTLVKSCLFETIIRFIEPNLFKASPYPVILSIENHCSAEQRKEMAQILRRILGDRLIMEPFITRNPSVLPSPEDLKYKVLVRGVQPSESKSIPKLIRIEEIDPSSNKTSEDDPSDVFIFFENVPFRDYNYAKDHYFCFHSSSLSESQIEDVGHSDPIGLIKQTQQRLLRMYPDGFRQDSSNPNPINAWNFGIHMVALNYQNDDQQMSLCYGKFLDNGGCGYVLKPQYLIDIDKSHFNPMDDLSKPTKRHDHPQRLIVTIISGQFLSRSNKKSDDIPDPYVIVSTHGISCDQQKYRTKFIENNGLNPRWDETFTFDIYFPQMCLVRFDVYDYDVFSRDDRIAYFCLPMTIMQTGYRHVHLRSKDHDSSLSTLFVHIAIENI